MNECNLAVTTATVHRAKENTLGDKGRRCLCFSPVILMGEAFLAMLVAVRNRE